MRRTDPPGSYRQRRRGPEIGADERDQLRRRDDIDNEIDRAHLMKGNRVNLDAMHLGFRLGQKLENRGRMSLDVSVEAGAAEFGANAGPRPVAAMTFGSASVSVMAVAFMSMRARAAAIAAVPIRGGRQRRRQNLLPAKKSS